MRISCALFASIYSLLYLTRSFKYRGTNPYEGTLGGSAKKNDGGVKVLGSDGLNIADLRRFLTTSSETSLKDGEEGKATSDKVSASSCIDALNQTLNYGHIAPTGPDSLPTFPSSESDPFVLNTRPKLPVLLQLP